ncbi:MAG TPA: copper chaperone PCu(A)C [Bellilinea sp.]|nr:copper chaperone PCu(A)C [Bellilinea sp.]
MQTSNRLVILLHLFLLLAACSKPPAGIRIDDAWVRASGVSSPMGETFSKPMTAAYLLITNDSHDTDRLLGAESPEARVVEIHQTVMQNDVASMQHMPSVEIPGGGTLKFEPGGYHLMLIDLQQPLAAGDEIEITLNFENAGPVTTTAIVND